MKKIHGLFVCLMLALVGVNAQSYQVVENSYQRVKITFETPAIQTQDVKVGQDFYTRLIMDDYIYSQEVGAPQLPVFSRLIEIPLCDSVLVSVTASEYVDMDASELGVNHAVIPVQPSYPKSYRGEKPFVKNADLYARNAFYTQPLVRVEKSGIMRDVNLANIAFSPVSYNPVTGKFRICRRMEVEISYLNANIPATMEMKARYGSPLFNVAEQTVMNPMPRTRDEFTQTRIKYLIIANSMFANNDYLIQYANWKKRIGYDVVIAYTGDANVGTTTTSIKNYIMSHYTNATADNPAPSFLLFVGDVAQVPAFNTQVSGESHVTDLYYATWTSGDYIPDCYYSRFSAQNVSQLVPQIEKNLMYEQYTMPDPSYLGKAVLVAGTDNNWSTTHANGQINYITNNYISTGSSTHNYTTIYTHLHPCNSQAATIRSEIGAGVGWANYTAHGSEDGWYQPEFVNSQVPSMTNEGKYGVMIGNCCVSGKFDESTCFGEALLRAANKGAMAYIGASNNSLWNEDFYWAVGLRSNITANVSYNASNLGAYDRIFHTHSENHDKWVTTLGGMVMAGNSAVESSTSSEKRYYWEIYHVFGDASIRPYLGIPSTMTVSCQDVLMVGTSSLAVQAPAYAYVALTYQNNVVAAGFADASGNITLSFDPLLVGTYELAVGAQNYIQYFKEINVIVTEGPYVMASQLSTSGNATPVVGNSVNMDLTLENVGVAAASNVTATLTSLTAGVTVTNATCSCNPLAPNATSDISNAFTVNIPETIEDGARVNLKLTVSWNGGQNERNFSFIVAAPIFQKANVSIRNQDGSTTINPGDLATVTVVCENAGHAVLTSAVVSLTSKYSGAVVNTPAHSITQLQPGYTSTKTFQVQVGNDVPTGSLIPLYFHKVFSSQEKVDTLYMLVGSAVETFETGDFSAFPWENTGNNRWIITSSQPYAGSYCARSKQNLGNSQSSTMQITMNSYSDGVVSYYRKVSSENGYDFFYFFVDGEQMEKKSGTVAWGLSSFPVSAGTHTYKFVYEKDYYTASGSDCAWIDNVTLPGAGTLVTEDINDVGVDVREAAQVHVFPNPATDRVTVSAETPIDQIQVFGIDGRLLGVQNANSDAHIVDIHNLATGIYILKVRMKDGETVNTKIIKR
ncbi:MAG: T9SS type A sorting domain-containing protein [Bacteroidales bacterium]|nr:T9SS type A sorting domain-containing protein [Bacteroidales bacterium]